MAKDTKLTITNLFVESLFRHKAVRINPNINAYVLKNLHIGSKTVSSDLNFSDSLIIMACIIIVIHNLNHNNS